MLTTMDALVLILIVGLGLWGAIRGFVAEVLALFTWFSAIYALKLLHGPVSLLVRHHLGIGAGAAAVIGFALVFGIIYVAGRLVTAALARRTRRSVLGPADRLLGAGFGGLKGLLVATVAFLLVNLLIDVGQGQAATRPDWMRRSRTYPLLSASGRAVVDWVRMRRGTASAGGDAAANASDD